MPTTDRPCRSLASAHAPTVAGVAPRPAGGICRAIAHVLCPPSTGPVNWGCRPRRRTPRHTRTTLRSGRQLVVQAAQHAARTLAAIGCPELNSCRWLETCWMKLFEKAARIAEDRGSRISTTIADLDDFPSEHPGREQARAGTGRSRSFQRVGQALQLRVVDPAAAPGDLLRTRRPSGPWRFSSVAMNWPASNQLSLVPGVEPGVAAAHGRPSASCSR